MEGSPMWNAANVREHMEVMGSDGQCVGRVDGLEGSSIKLTREAPGTDGEHHYVPFTWVAAVDEKAVYLTVTSDEAREEWNAAPLEAGTG